MVTGKDGERANCGRFAASRRPTSRTLFATRSMADGTRYQQPFFHVQVRNPEGETLTRQQWEITANRLERMLGLTGQPRAIAFHTNEKTGHEHMHVAWSRIDQNTLTAKQLPFFKDRLKKISRELELHFGLTVVKNEREGPIKYAPTRAQEEQARRLGVDIHQVRNTIRACWDRSDCGRTFEAALADQGLTLAQGDRRGFVVIDDRGGLHVLSKRILDVTAAKIRDRLSDLDRDQLPTVEQARDFIREASRQRQPEKPAPAWDRERDDQALHDAVIKAAIEKEKIEHRFMASVTPVSGREVPFPRLGCFAGGNLGIVTRLEGSDPFRTSTLLPPTSTMPLHSAVRSRREPALKGFLAGLLSLFGHRFHNWLSLLTLAG